jgi:tyrosinase
VATNRYEAPVTIAAQQLDINFSRADIEFEGVDHSGATYEGRVFLNNPKADATTPPTRENGYAGAFHIFGHGGCFGDDEGHCTVRPRRRYDPRPAHGLTPARKVVIATEAVREALAAGPNVTVKVVPIVRTTTPKAGPEDVFSYELVSIVTYR